MASPRDELVRWEMTEARNIIDSYLAGEKSFYDAFRLAKERMAEAEFIASRDPDKVR